MGDDGVRDLRAALAAHGQEGLLRFWDELDAAGRERLERDLRSLDLDLLDRLVETLAAFPEADLHDSANFPWLAGEPWNGAELFGHFHDEHEADMRAWLDKVRSAEQ